MHCDFFQRNLCRSCSLLEFTCEQTIQQKWTTLRQVFPECHIHPFQNAPAEGSRIRARIAVAGPLDDLQLGFLDEHRQLVAVENCPLHHPAINQLLQRLKPLLIQYRLTPWCVESNQGELKNMILTCAPHSQRLMVQLVLRSQESTDRIRRMWQHHRQSTLRDVEVLSINLQPARTSVLTGDQELAVSDNQRLCVRFGNTDVLYGPRSFIQTNHQMASQLYTLAANLILKDRAASLLDIYCGSGAFSLIAASRMSRYADQPKLDRPESDSQNLWAADTNCSAIRVHGFDISSDSIDNARVAAAQLGLPASSYQCIDASVTDMPFAASVDATICNPPRRGLDAATVSRLLQLRTGLLLYSSCNPVTLRRDMNLLSPAFEFTHLHPFDMFPFTSHMEVLAVGRPTTG